MAPKSSQFLYLWRRSWVLLDLWHRSLKILTHYVMFWKFGNDSEKSEISNRLGQNKNRGVDHSDVVFTVALLETPSDLRDTALQRWQRLFKWRNLCVSYKGIPLDFTRIWALDRLWRAVSRSSDGVWRSSLVKTPSDSSNLSVRTT